MAQYVACAWPPPQFALTEITVLCWNKRLFCREVGTERRVHGKVPVQKCGECSIFANVLKFRKTPASGCLIVPKQLSCLLTIQTAQQGLSLQTPVSRFSKTNVVFASASSLQVFRTKNCGARPDAR